jgi:hypothetical protein
MVAKEEEAGWAGRMDRRTGKKDTADASVAIGKNST